MVRILLFTFLFSSPIYFAQTTPFGIVLEPFEIANLGGLQSYSYGQDKGKWLIVGGRLDGLHKRQPFAAFDQNGQNNQLMVVDPSTQQKWSAPILSLEQGLQEQLKSTNMQFYQVGNYLYLTGGYGYSATNKNHITFPFLIAIDIRGTIEAILAGNDITPFFRQIQDEQFQVTGGRLEKIDSTFYLIGGHKFIGRYNPMGPKNGPGFFQEYTEAIRRFHLIDDGKQIKINHLPTWKDSLHLHRRDLNVTPQILPAGEEGISIFSGVFRHAVDLPWSNSITIDQNSYVADSSFSQFYNSYHCGNIPVYSETKREMHTLFFGGISQYYDEKGMLVQDNLVPFVKTISRITRDKNGRMEEYKLNTEMPSLLGAGSEFIPTLSLPRYSNGVFKLDEFTADSTLIGYLFGGISSKELNILFKDEDDLSKASSTLFKVYLVRNTLGSDVLNPQCNSSLHLDVLPDAFKGTFDIKFNLEKTENVRIRLVSSEGKVIRDKKLKNEGPGEIHIILKSRHLRYFGDYFLTVETSSETVQRKIVVDY